MKKIMIIIFLTATTLFCQNTNNSKISLQITISVGGNITQVYNVQDTNGFIAGVLYNGLSGQLIGSSRIVDFDFLDSRSEVFWYHKKNPKEIITDSLYEKFYPQNTQSKKEIFNCLYLDFDKLVHYSFFPEILKTGDSVAVYCKYILYEKKGNVKTNKNNYDISFYEEFLTVPLNKEITLDFLRNIFPNATENKTIFSLDKTDQEPKQSLLKLDDYSIGIHDVKESVKKRVEQKSKFKIDIEYLRTDKDGKEILEKKKMDSSKKIYRVHPDIAAMVDFFLNIYEGSTSVPFKMFNPEKQELFAKSKYYNSSQFKYSVKLIPLDQNKDSQLFCLIITREIWGGRMSYSKQIYLEIGKPMRISLEAAGGLFRNDEVVDGKRLRLNLKEDYSNYVNDYIILSLESDE